MQHHVPKYNTTLGAFVYNTAGFYAIGFSRVLRVICEGRGPTEGLATVFRLVNMNETEAGNAPKTQVHAINRIMKFDHVGLITTEKKAGEMFIPATKVWVTNFQGHPYNIEWLRFEPDSPVSGPVRDMPHVAFSVDSIKEASRGMKVLIEPFDAEMAIVGFFESEDGAVVEFMEYKKEGSQWQASNE